MIEVSGGSNQRLAAYIYAAGHFAFLLEDNVEVAVWKIGIGLGAGPNSGTLAHSFLIGCLGGLLSRCCVVGG